MLTSQAEHEIRPRPAYRAFSAFVARVQRLSPHFLRVTFTGEDLADFGTAGFDQRVKLVFPLADTGFAWFPSDDDWYRAWRDLPAEHRNPFRTYTIRAVRPEVREVDVDFVNHGDHGPASHWVTRATPGDELIIIGPDERSPGRTVGIDWRPGSVETVLLAGDETAVPAIGAILQSLPAETLGAAIIEVPSAADRLDLEAPAGVSVRWLARDAGAETEAGTSPPEHGELLIGAVRDHVARSCTRAGAASEITTDTAELQILEEAAAVADTPLWDVPEGTSLDGDLYAWLAGEASVITALRRFIVRDAGLDRRQVAFMGYWRAGRAELD